MKKLSFAIALLGIFMLLILLNILSPVAVNNSSDLSKLIENTKVQATGKIISERTLYANTKLINLDNNIEIICIGCQNYLNQTIKVVGITDKYEKYENKTQIKALKIEKVE